MKQIKKIIFLPLLLLLMPMPALAAETDYSLIIDPIAQEMIGETVPGACVVISEGGKIVFSRGYGFANLDQKYPMNPEETVFEWGSISKTFVWISVMQLEEKESWN